MNKEEFLKAEKTLKEELEIKKKQLLREFAYSNNPVKIGDIITDHYKTIRVEKFLWGRYFGTPFSCMFYRGTRLTKKGEPAKRDTDDNSMSQTDIREINGKPYKYELK
jgi:hypothetical protein